MKIFLNFKTNNNKFYLFIIQFYNNIVSNSYKNSFNNKSYNFFSINSLFLNYTNVFLKKNYVTLSIYFIKNPFS